MRRFWMHVAALSLVLPTTAALAQDLTKDTLAARDKALADDTAWSLVESLSTEIGARPVGSPALARARDWGVGKLKALGFENVHVENFTTRAWSRGPESAEVVAPYPQKLAILGLGNSSPTPRGGLTAEIVVFHTYQEMLDQPVGALKGKIAVVTQATPRTQSGEGYSFTNTQRMAGPTEAAKRGAAAYLIRSISTAEDRVPHTGVGDPAGIPAAALSPADAELLDHMVARGKPVSVKLDLESTTNPAAEAYNVVGEIRGSRAPDEVIVVGGHLDSWDQGTGAVDDGSGVAITVAAARIVGSMPHRPQRTIRVVMWGSEEQFGSGAAYFAAHKSEVDKMIVTSESDAGADHLWLTALPKGSANAPAMRALQAAIIPLKVIISRAPATNGGADTTPLSHAGVPVFDFEKDATRYLEFHHSANDTLDKIDREHLAQNVAVWTSMIYAVANSDVDFRRLAAADKSATPQP